MASDYHYYNNHCYYSNSDSHHQSPSLPFHLCCFLSILVLFLSLSCYMSYQPAVEGLFDQIKTLLMLLPVVLLLAVHCLSGVDRRWVPFPWLPERESFNSASGSPWGVAMVLVLLIFMVSYKSSFQERLFPLSR